MLASVFVAAAVMAVLGGGAAAQSERPLHYMPKQCNEHALVLHLESSPFQDFVGSGFPILLEDGKARVLIVHDCSEYWIDGEDVGSTQHINVWVAIEGSEDVRRVVGAEKTLPTRTWFSLFAGSSNPRVREVKGESGTVVASIRELVLDPPGRQGGGRVLLDRDLQYSWHASS